MVGLREDAAAAVERTPLVPLNGRGFGEIKVVGDELPRP